MVKHNRFKHIHDSKSIQQQNTSPALDQKTKQMCGFLAVIHNEL